jgi:hypothetical protein
MIESAQVESPVADAPIATPEHKAAGVTRLISLDALRGLVMVLMLNEKTRLHDVARAFPHSAIWALIAYNTEHVDWQGCSLHDLIQPAFSFLVGAAVFDREPESEGTNLRPDAGPCHPARADSDLSGNFSSILVVASDLLHI